MGLALAQGRLEAGLWLASRPGPALEGGLALGEGEVFVRLLPTRFGLGYLGSLSLGPWGFLAYGLQGEVGEGGWGGAVYGEGGVGPLLWEGRLGFRPKAAPPLFLEEGLFLRLALRLRLPFGEALGLELARNTPWRPSSFGLQPGRAAWLLEGSYALRQGALLGAGLFPWPYALLGYRDGILDFTLRLGGINRLEAGLYLGEASLFLILSYPFAGSVGAWLGDLGLEVGLKAASPLGEDRETLYAWVRYAWRWP